MPHILTDLAGLKVRTDDFLETVLDTAAQPIWVVDPGGVIRFANPAAVAALGYDDAKQLLGRPSHETIHYRHSTGRDIPQPPVRCSSRGSASREQVATVSSTTVPRDVGGARAPSRCGQAASSAMRSRSGRLPRVISRATRPRPGIRAAATCASIQSGAARPRGDRRARRQVGELRAFRRNNNRGLIRRLHRVAGLAETGGRVPGQRPSERRS